MSVLSWPSGRHFIPSSMRWSINAPKAAFAAPYTGQVQSISHVATRWHVAMSFGACRGAQAAEREAFFDEAVAQGAWFYLRNFARLVPNGTMRGTPTLTANALTGATSLAIHASAGATLLPGDLIGVSGQLLKVGHAGAVFDGSGNATVPLAVPIRNALASGASVLWDAPEATFQITASEVVHEVNAPGVWTGLEVSAIEVATYA